MAQGHPLFHKLLSTLGKDGDRLLIESGALAEVRAGALAVERGDELYGLIGQLVSFAAFLRAEKGSPEASLVIIDLVMDLAPRLEELVRAQGAARGADPVAALKMVVARERAAHAEGLAPQKASGVGLRKK